MWGAWVESVTVREGVREGECSTYLFLKVNMFLSDVRMDDFFLLRGSSEWEDSVHTGVLTFCCPSTLTTLCAADSDELAGVLDASFEGRGSKREGSLAARSSHRASREGLRDAVTSTTECAGASVRGPSWLTRDCRGVWVCVGGRGRREATLSLRDLVRGASELGEEALPLDPLLELAEPRGSDEDLLSRNTERGRQGGCVAMLWDRCGVARLAELPGERRRSSGDLWGLQPKLTLSGL